MRRRVKVINQNNKYRINKTLVKKIASNILKHLKKDAELEIIFLEDGAIRRLNKRFKKRDRSTDVLSFLLEGEEFGLRNFFGEIFISPDAARRNARAFNTKFEEEICRYVIHGILHLSGYDDGTPAERRRMSKKEDKILEGLCTREVLSRVLTPP